MLVAVACVASLSVFAGERIKLDRLTLDEGLSQVSAQVLLQDRQGFVWIGTQDGLNRFDGYEVVVFKHDSANPASLVDNFVRTLFEDREGKIWVLTQQPGGIHRYDPSTETFQRFSGDGGSGESKTAPPLPLPGVIHQDEKGRVWFSTNLGVERLDPETGRVDRFAVDPGNPDALAGVVSVFYQDRQGVLWLGTFGGGLHRYDPGAENRPEGFRRFSARPGDPTSLSNDVVSTVLEDSQGDLWVGTQGGGVVRLVDREAGVFARWDQDFETPLPSSMVPRFLPGVTPPVDALLEDSEGSLWVVTTGGLVRRRGDEVTVFAGTEEAPNFFRTNAVVAIEDDPWGNLWVATSLSGVVRLERGADRFEHLRHDPADPHSLPSNQMSALMEDRAGVLWLGTNSGGAARYSRYRHKVKHYRRPPTAPSALSDNMVFALEQDRRGDVWVGTPSGLYRLGPRRRQVVEHYFADPSGGPKNLGAPLVRSVVEASDGSVWVGTLGGGLARIDPALGRVAERFTSGGSVGDGTLSSNQVFGIHEDRLEPGILWIATNLGWNRFDRETGKFRTFLGVPGDATSIAANFVRCTYEDPDGVLWLCTGGGVSRFDRKTETFRSFVRDAGDPESLANNNVMDLWNDGRGTLWIATYGGGLDRLDLATGKVRHLNHKDGLPSDSLYSLLPDDRGLLWISSNQGLIRLDPETLQLDTFDVGDGLQSTEFNGRSFAKAADGELMFGGVNGWNAFYPGDVEGNPEAPEVVLTDFKVFDVPRRFDRALGFLDTVRLSYKDRFFAFEFAALDFTDPESNRYAYRMEGFDEDWVDAGSRRFAGYTNLDGGTYTFRVKAANADGLWNPEGASIRVVIVPPWWRTWWAYGLYALALVGAVFLYVRHKTLRHREEIRLHREESERQRLLAERLRQIDRMKDEFLANTSHELRTPLNGIIGLAESLLDGVAGPLSDAGRRNLGMIAGSGRRLAHLVDDILDFSKLKNHQIELQVQAVSLREVADIVLTLMGPLVSGKDVELRNRVPADLPPVAGDENRLQQILHNLVGNAVKFTDRGSVTVDAEARGDEVILRVTDTGIGIPEDKLERVFEGFEQADASTAREHGGTGLGLTITRQLVELHGGSIHLEPGDDRGLRAVLTLPRWEGEVPAETRGRPLASLRDGAGRNAFLEATRLAAPAAEDPGRESSAGSREQGRILVVDDEPVNLQVLDNMLSLAGFEVVRALDGRQALELVAESPPDLVLLDVMMPRMTGFEVTRRLRERWSGNQLPILLVTAKNQVSDLMEGMASGANDYLSKPVSKNELLARIETHLSLSRAHSVEAEHRRKSEEFERARSIQLSMLPEAPPALDRFEIAVHLETATEVGGDYYDFFPQDGEGFYVVTGDATGHGISAGMMVSMTKSALKALEVQSPHVLLRQLNQVFRSVRVEHMKMALNVLHVRGDEVALASAAMPPVLVYRAESGRVEEIMSSSLPLGSLPDLEYSLEVFELGPGDTMVLLSDGLPETWGEEQSEPLGYDAVQECLQAHGRRSPGEVLGELLSLGKQWRGERPLDDDVTLIVVQRRA